MNTQFEYFENILDESISVLASRGFLEFLLYQYDQYSKVEQEFKNRKLSSSDEEFWKEYGSLARRGIKYLIELMCHFQIKDMKYGGPI